MARRLAIGIDLGGTKIEGALVDDQGQTLAARRRETPRPAAPAEVFAAMREMIHELEATAAAPLLGVGLGIPGPVDAERGLSLISPNLGWREVPVLPAFADLGLPVAMENDVRCHALGELAFGAGRGLSDFILITLGTGIGSGIILGGRLYRGGAKVAGEIGHITVAPGGPACGCGKQGCLEAVAGGPAIGRRAQAAGIADSAPELFARAAAGHPAAAALVDAVACDLARGISAYANLMNPQAIILGGGVMAAGDVLLEPLRRHVAHETMPGIRGTYEITPARVGPGAGAIGAATLVPGLVPGLVLGGGGGPL